MKRPKRQTLMDHRRRVRTVMSFIDQNLDKVCPVDRLAQEACLSPFHFNRVFTGCTGETLMQYWLRIRLEHAARNLLYSKKKVIDIALEIGYESHHAFSKAFKAWFGASPRRFRDHQTKIDHWGYAFKGHGRPRSTFGGSSPFIKTIGPLQLIYFETSGLLTGSFVQSGMELAIAMESAIRQLGLFRYVTGWVSAFPTRPTRFRDPGAAIQVGAIVSRPIDGIGPLKTRFLGGGRWAVFCHLGPLEFLYQTWNAIYFNLLPANGLRPRDETPFEWYKDLFSSTPPPLHQTYLYIPIH